LAVERPTQLNIAAASKEFSFWFYRVADPEIDTAAFVDSSDGADAAFVRLFAKHLELEVYTSSAIATARFLNENAAVLSSAERIDALTLGGLDICKSLSKALEAAGMIVRVLWLLPRLRPIVFPSHDIDALAHRLLDHCHGRDWRPSPQAPPSALDNGEGRARPRPNASPSSVSEGVTLKMWRGEEEPLTFLTREYEALIRERRIHAHELRQRDRKLYEALSQLFTRNKRRGRKPDTFADVMPVDENAKNGWKARLPPTPPSPEEASAILERQRLAERERKKRARALLKASRQETS
jgi:hypothetical protein